MYSRTNSLKTFDVVYNLYPVVEDFFLVNALIVSKDKEGFLAHIKQKANKSTIEAYGLNLDEQRLRLFDVIEKLQPHILAEKFKPARKKNVALEQLLQDRDSKKKIQAYVHRLLDDLLTVVWNNELSLSWDAEKKVLVEDFVIKLRKKPLQPHLFFEKTDKSIRYRFHLEDEEGIWAIHTRDVAPITNHPAWVFVDYQLYKVAHINGNMVKPFRTKEEVIIPNTSVRAYFQKFILKVASKVEISATGFDIIEESKLEHCIIEPVKDFIEDQWGLVVKMDYGIAEFLWNEKRKNRTSLNFSDGQNVQIVKVVRNFSLEKNYLSRLQAFNLTNSSGAYFQLENEIDDEFALLEWLIKQRKQFEEKGFTIRSPYMHERKLALYPAELKVNMDRQNDWFDLYGDVFIGPFKIPFVNFAQHIRERNRFYKLPNGDIFIIPLEWLTKYKALFQFGKKEREKLKLAKSQFMLLEELEGIEPNIEGNGQEDFDFEVPEELNATLRPYQLEGVKWLVRHNKNELGACLADDMGLGKTLQTIAVLVYAKTERRQADEETNSEVHQLNLFQPTDRQWLNPLNALVILPASLVYNWEKEIKKFAPKLSVYKHIGAKRSKDVKLIVRWDVILTTYQTVLRDVGFLDKIEYEYIVLDESQQIKNKDSKIFKAINTLTAKHKISLSGTPIENSLSDLWAQMHFINPNLLGNYNFFRREFITPIEKRQNEEKKVRLRKLVQPYLLRRTKEEVASDLPPLTVRVYYSVMNKDQKKLYEKEKSAARNYLLENYDENNPKYRMMVLQSLTKLRQIANHPQLVHSAYEKGSSKYKDVMDQWEVVKKGNHKVLIFSSFVKYLELFKKDFEAWNEPYSWLTGSLDSAEREKQIAKFESNEAVRSFLISIKSGGTGLNLVAADYVFILDPWWNPFTEQQAIARAHRIGQHKNVIAFKFITKDSIEEKILRLQERKTKLAQDIIDHTQKTGLTKRDLEYLLD